MTVEPPKEKGENPVMDILKKHWIPIVGGLVGICAVLLLTTVVNPPKEGLSPEQAQIKEEPELVSTEKLQIGALTRRMEEAEANIKKIYNNQVALNKRITDLIDADKLLEKANSDNRSYVALIYQKVLDLELQVGNIGGGFNVRPPKRDEPINPLMGTDSLPKNQ